MGNIAAIAGPVAFAALVVLAYWPRWGLLVRWKRYRELAGRERAEHVLKHLHHCQYSGLTASLDSLAGSIGVTRNRAARLVSRLEAIGLVTSSAGRIELTPVGRSNALRVIRVHRLWERYFADYTSLDEALWHDEADRREHTTSEAEAQRLAEKLGNPRFDPHGAPIPTPSGELPSLRGLPLGALHPYERATIVHVEDEPAEVYAQLAAQGLTVGAVIRVLDSTPAQIRLDIAGEEQIVAPVVASNVSVERLATVDPEPQRCVRLSQVDLGEKVRVVGVLPTCHGPQRRRLLDLGVVPGTKIHAELPSAAGDPVAYRIRGALMALRRSQAEQIQVERVVDGSTSDVLP